MDAVTGRSGCNASMSNRDAVASAGGIQKLKLNGKKSSQRKMTDEEYVFHQTVRERKRNGYGDFHKKRRGGRNVRLPSDNLSRKEKKKMSGDCVTWQLDVPHTIEEFREFPDEIKIEYLNHLHDKYRVTPKDIAKMLGRSYYTLHEEMLKLGVSWGSGQRASKDDYLKWEEFLATKTEKIPVKADEVDFNVLAEWLKKSGAKVTLEISWG